MTNVIGIDPGLGGALSLLDSDAKVLDLIDMPTLHTTKSRRVIDESRVISWLRWANSGGDVRAIIETAMIMPKQGSASGFKIGVGYGTLLGILSALYIPRIQIAPQSWQKAIIGKGEAGTSKDRARVFAQRTWPEADLGSRKSQDRADALCLALYGIRYWTNAVEAAGDEAA